jgi:hypothetical protein
MMTKKRLLLIASLPLTIAVTLGVLAMLPPSPGVTKANFDRIEKGMPKAEIEAIFGGKAITIEPWFGGIRDNPGAKVAVWKANDESKAGIVFMNSCVFYKEWQDSNETLPDKLRRWLHLR